MTLMLLFPLLILLLKIQLFLLLVALALLLIDAVVGVNIILDYNLC